MSIASSTSVQVPAPIRASHRITPGERHCVVHEVELFAEMPDGPLGAVDAAKLASIAEATNAKVRQGLFPSIVLRHTRDALNTGSAADPRALGRIAGEVRVAKSARTGLMSIVGDLEIPAKTFHEYVASGHYPRRSAEISPDTLDIRNIALLGREAPRATIPDLLVASDKPAVEIEPPGLSPIVIQEQSMTTAELISGIKALSADDKAALFSAIAADVPGLTFAAPKPPKAPEPAPAPTTEPTADFSANPAIVALKAKVGELETLRKRDGYMARLAEMSAKEGIELTPADEIETIMAFSTDEAREAWFEKIKKNYRRSPSQDLVNGSNTLGNIVSHATGPDKTVQFSSADASRVSTLASKLMAEKGMGENEAFSEAAKQLGFSKALGLQG